MSQNLGCETKKEVLGYARDAALYCGSYEDVQTFEEQQYKLLIDHGMYEEAESFKRKAMISALKMIYLDARYEAKVRMDNDPVNAEKNFLALQEDARKVAREFGLDEERFVDGKFSRIREDN